VARKNYTALTKEERTKTEQHATTLFGIADLRFQDVTNQVRTALQGVIDNPVVYARNASANDENSGHYRYQIIETAKALNYYANLTSYKSWVNLTIRINDAQTELLLSFHILGYEYRGILVCSACAYHKASSDEGDRSLVQDIQPLSQSPFQITYSDEINDLQERFRRWLENIIIVGLEYWRKGL
jgi:hypothetical protein